MNRPEQGTLNVQYSTRHGAYCARYNLTRDQAARVLDKVARDRAHVYDAGGRLVGKREMQDGKWIWWVE